MIPPPSRPPVIRAFDTAAAIIACAILIALLAVVLLGIVTRELDDPLIWTDELARVLMVWLAMFGWILASRRRGHVRIRFFQDLLPTPLHRAAEIAIQLGIFGLGVIVGCFGFDLVDRNADLEATTMPISMAWMYAPLIPAGIVTALQAVSEIAGAVHTQAQTAEAVRGPPSPNPLPEGGRR